MPEEHLAYFIADLTTGLDISMIYTCYERRDGRGKVPLIGWRSGSRERDGTMHHELKRKGLVIL